MVRQARIVQSGKREHSAAFAHVILVAFLAHNRHIYHVMELKSISLSILVAKCHENVTLGGKMMSMMSCLVTPSFTMSSRACSKYSMYSSKSLIEASDPGLSTGNDCTKMAHVAKTNSPTEYFIVANFFSLFRLY